MMKREKNKRQDARLDRSPDTWQEQEKAQSYMHDSKSWRIQASKIQRRLRKGYHGRHLPYHRLLPALRSGQALQWLRILISAWPSSLHHLIYHSHHITIYLEDLRWLSSEGLPFFPFFLLASLREFVPCLLLWLLMPLPRGLDVC